VPRLFQLSEIDLAVVSYNKDRQWLLWIVPNPAITGIDFDGLTYYVWSILSRMGDMNLTVANFLAHHPAKFVIPVFFAADVCFSDDGDKEAAASSVQRGSFQQSGRQVSPIWIYCGKILRMSSNNDTRHQLTAKAVCHESFHTLAGIGHSADRRDLMYEQLIPGDPVVNPLDRRIFLQMLGK
jgi:hypothetical protein